LIAATGLLAACATAYQPHAGDDAARLRVRLDRWLEGPHRMG